MLTAVDCQDKRAGTQERHGMKTDRQRGEQGSNYTDHRFSLARVHADIPIEKKFEEILKWLDGLNCAEKQDITLSLRQEDTCKWLFDTTQYKRWKDGENESLWLRGKRESVERFYSPCFIDQVVIVAGAGKSVLAYVHILYISTVLTMFAGRSSSIPSRWLCPREKSLYFSIVILETSVLQALR